MKHFFALLLAIGLVLAGAMRVSAQEIVPIGTKRLYKLEELLQNIQKTPVEAVAVTFLPSETILWLDGQPLEPYTMLDAKTASRVYVFSAGVNGTTGIGVTPLSVRSSGHEKQPIRIRSVNPYFSD